MLPLLLMGAVRVLVPTIGLWIARQGVNELQRRGFQTTYLMALGRAMGAGLNAATAAKVDPFSQDGMKLVAAVGAKYLLDNVSTAAASLGIDNIQAGETRILAELGKLRGHMMASGTAPTVARVEPASAVVAPAMEELRQTARPLAYTGDESQLTAATELPQDMHG